MDLWPWIATLVLVGTAAFFIMMWPSGMRQPTGRRTDAQRLTEMPIKRPPG